MRRTLTAVLLAGVVAWAQRYTPTPYNTLVWTDTLRIDSTETEYTQIFWQDNGMEKVLLVEGSDTASAGFGSDSACVGLTLYQVFPLSPSVVARLNSRAHPDSTTYPGGSSWSLKDSLDIKSMADTSSCVLARSAVKRAVVGTGDTTRTYGDDFGSAQTGYGGFWYVGIAPDASPGVTLRVIGKANNAKRGAGSRWVFRLYQVNGQPVRSK